MWIKKKVNELVDKHKSNNPFELAEMLKIQVIHRNLHKEIMGFYFYDRRNKYIFINSNLNENQMNFVCGHEVGHGVLHPTANTPFMREKTLFSTNKIEAEANIFAVELLLPDEALFEYRNMNFSIYDVARIHGVPPELCHLKKLSKKGGVENVIKRRKIF
ncbi:ImmA/IrrE family metallo-endopeptidase [Bacillus swezeyi]|nr:ImmA/IrrE family metallo-endopeptidase [Bacillus swezeyi]